MDVYHELRDRTEELGEIVTREYGRELSEGRADVVEAAHTVELSAGNARYPHGDMVHAVTERTAWTLNNATAIRMAQGLSAEIKTDE